MFIAPRKERQEAIFILVKQVWNLLYSYSVPKRQIYHFFVKRNEFIVPYCLRQYLGLAARCCRYDFSPMMNNLFVKFWKMAIKIKKVAIVITLKEVSATEKKRGTILEYTSTVHLRQSTAVLPKLISKPYRKEQNLSYQDRHLLFS